MEWKKVKQEFKAGFFSDWKWWEVMLFALFLGIMFKLIK